MLKTILTGLLFAFSSFSTEVDSFTIRDPSMRDALPELNAMMHRYLEITLEKANQAKSCNPRNPEEILHQLMHGLAWSQIETDIEESKLIDLRFVTRANSIYRDICFTEGCALYMAKLGSLIRIGDWYVGSDKFGHFIDQGYDYYRSASLEEGIRFGETTERTYYGMLFSSIYSYGDLSANLDGYFFWSQLTGGENPYLTCHDQVWTKQRTFSWSDYTNAAWDEGLNCSLYKNDHVSYSVQARIIELGMTCPVDKDYCPEMIEHYGLLAPHVINQECLISG